MTRHLATLVRISDQVLNLSMRIGLDWSYLTEKGTYKGIGTS